MNYYIIDYLTKLIQRIAIKLIVRLSFQLSPPLFFPTPSIYLISRIYIQINTYSYKNIKERIN